MGKKHLRLFALSIGTALAALSSPILLSAAILTLEPVVVVHQYQQTTNNPCVIGEESCSQGTFPDPTIFPSPATEYDETSPTYTVALLNSFFPGGFVVGVDVNQSSVDQSLSLFEMLINGVVVDSYSANPATLVPPTVGGGNGNGYADYILTGFTSLSGYLDDDEVTFRVVMPLVNDGREQFFLINTEAPPPPQPNIPEPSTYLLLGSGLFVIGYLRRRR